MLFAVDWRISEDLNPLNNNPKRSCKEEKGATKIQQHAVAKNNKQGEAMAKTINPLAAKMSIPRLISQILQSDLEKASRKLNDDVKQGKAIAKL